MEEGMHMGNATEARDVFAQGLSFYKLVWVFIAGSLIGTWYEEIYAFIRYGTYENRSAVFFGPFNPLYGLAFVLILLLLRHFQSAPAAILAGAIFCGVFEYSANFAQEFFTGSVSWNYEDKILNINGRTTLLYALFFGVFSYVMVFHVYPLLSRWIESLPVNPARAITKVMIVFLILNMVVTYSALIRQGLRAEGLKPYTPVGEFYDSVFTDDYIGEKFPNMRLIEGDEHE